MKNELKLVILGMLYSDQIEYLKTINTNLNPDYDLTNNKCLDPLWNSTTPRR